MSRASQIIRSILCPLSEALNLIVESKSLTAEVNDLNMELHSSLRLNKSLQSYFSVDFDFLASMRSYNTNQ